MTVIEHDPVVGPAPTHPFTGASRWLAASAFAVGGALQLAEFILEPETDDITKRLAWWTRHSQRMDWSQASGILAILFLLIGVAVLWRLTRLDSARLAATAAVVLGSAMIGLGLIHGIELSARWTLLAGHPDAARSILDVKDARLPGIITFVMFLPAAVLGNLLMVAALWRSRYVPRLTALLPIAFVALDFVIEQGVLSHAALLGLGLVVGWAIVTKYQRKSSMTAAHSSG